MVLAAEHDHMELWWHRRANITQALNQQVHSTDIEVFLWRLWLLLTMGFRIPLDTKEMQALLLANLQQKNPGTQ